MAHTALAWRRTLELSGKIVPTHTFRVLLEDGLPVCVVTDYRP